MTNNFKGKFEFVGKGKMVNDKNEELDVQLEFTAIIDEYNREKITLNFVPSESGELWQAVVLDME